MQNGNSRAEVFRINDIDLEVPPTAIQINQEDLLYSWKTLRTSTSTKIASGQGHIRVHVTIPFTNGMLLSLHRLITEFKSSPFCSIDNNYLRHTIVPDWADFQQMAFTMTSINVNPLPDSSDTWICELDLLWFNYLPYSHNFLYRDDWTTDWISLDGEDSKQKYKLSIGWELDEKFKRTPRFSVVDTLNIEDPNEAKRWSLATTGYSKEANKVLKDIEAMHYGESFDLLPIPSGMVPANFVFDARNSRIYTRYINYLQRDALIKNFGFDVEEDLTTDVSAFFSAVKEENVLSTYSLTSNRVPAHIHNKWISKMLETNSGVNFKFHIYKNIKINPELLKKVRAEQGIPEPEKPNTGKTGTSYILNPTKDAGKDAAGPDGAFVEVRNGWWAPAGMHTPVGVNATSARPATIQEAIQLVTSTVKLRSEIDDQRLYAGDSSRVPAAKSTRVHKGTDFGVPSGTPVFAVADGTVSRTSLGSIGQGIQWSYFDKNTSNKRGKVKDSGYQADWENLISEIKLPFNSTTVQLVDKSWQTPGTVIKSKKHANVYYIAEYTSAGQSLAIEHSTGESVYMHLQSLTVSRGQTVKAGDLVGYTGRSSSYTDSFLNSRLNTTNIPIAGNFIRLNPDILLQQDPSIDVYSLRPHLHFEFRENRELPGVTDRTSSYNPSEIGGRVLVNPLPSWNEALDKSSPQLPAYLKPPTATEKESSAEIANAEDVTSTSTGDLLKMLHALGTAGWMYYEGSIKVSDIWQKVVEVNIQNQNNSGPDFINQGAVLMNVSGGLRHIVANIPILSHEYPTQQHLGSIEPVYSIDFAIRDDNLDGLSDEGKLLQSLRNLLQFNAREFRSIPDAWCVCTDTFITRFFGTYQVDDYTLEEINILGLEDTEKFSLPVLNKRSSIMRSGANTSPTNPGVSFINFEVQETNPFSAEKIMPTAITRSDKEAIRKKVLHKLYSLDFITKDASLATIVALGQASNKDFFEVGSSEFGKLSIPSFTDSSELSAAGFPDIALLRNGNASENKILVKIRSKDGEAPLSSFQQVLSNTYRSDFNQSELEEYIEMPTWFIEDDASFDTGNVPVGVNGTDYFLKNQDTRIYDFSELILDRNFDAQLANINYAKLLEYHKVLKDTLRYAEFTIAEHSSKKRSDIPYALDEDSFIGVDNRSSEGLTNEEVIKELYDLPFDAKMWRAWQQWLSLTVYRVGGSSALNEVINDSSWMTWKETLTTEDLHLLNRLSANTSSVDFYTSGISGMIGSVPTGFHGARDILPLLSSFTPGSITTEVLFRSIASSIFRVYSGVFPLSYNFQFLGDSWDYNNLVGSLAGVSEATSRPRAFERFEFSLANCLATSKYIGPESTTEDHLAFISKTNPINHTLNDFLNNNISSDSGKVALSIALPFVAPAFVAGGTNDYSGKFTYVVTTAAEKEKALFFKQRLADLAQSIIADSKLMEAMGLLDEALVVQEGNLNETDAYPDLTLPFHPFFGDTLSSDPDFYFWNIYDDGQAFGQQVQSVIKDNIFSVVENSYNSIKLMEQGKTLNPAVGASGKGLVEEIGMESFKIPLKFNAEGTDSATYGPMGSVFTMTEEMNDGANDFFNKLINENSKLQNEAASQQGVKSGGEESTSMPTGRLGMVQLLASPTAAISMSATEGVAGVGGGVQYSSRLSIDEYKNLRKELKDITKMFGTRKGFSEANITNDNSPLADRTATSLLGRPDEYTHGFDKSSLQKLALDSSKDIASRRMSLKRATPTFKLYFVEEDENESRILNLDDFYSYNAVHSFTCELSKKSAADHLIITLQNVSGTLDGTAHNALVDLDYFDKDINKLVPEDASTYSGNAINQDTQSEQPFNSVVLRPGLNVQLRAGYCVDDQTEILTKRGWLKYDEVEVGDVTLTLNHKTGKSEWQPIERVNKFWVEDEEMISIEGIKHSSLTTLNHRWPVYKKNYLAKKSDFDFYSSEWVVSEELNTTHALIGGAKYSEIPKIKKWSDSFVKLIAWFWTEGHIRNKGVNRNPIIEISQSRSANLSFVNEIQDILVDCFGSGVDHLGTGNRWGQISEAKWRRKDRVTRDETVFILNSIAAKEILSIAPDRIVNTEWIQDLTEDQLKLFIETSNKGDGHYSKLVNGALLISQKNADQLLPLELAANLLGLRTRLYTNNKVEKDRNGVEYNLTSLLISRDEPLIKLWNTIKPKKVKYTGTTWCPKTKNQSWFARRNGYSYFTGNSNDPDNLHVLISGRVVDIQWNKNGDLAELLVQSYGTELIQQLKGTQRDGDTKVFYTTHELLGNLMLSPELAHFGRWEIGQLTQHGESKDARLDFYDYQDKMTFDAFDFGKRRLDLVKDAWNNGSSFAGIGINNVKFGISEAATYTVEGVARIYDYISTRVSNFFTAKKVSLFLSPQDDNLYPPHPKDYMTINPGLFNGALKDLHSYSQQVSDSNDGSWTSWIGAMSANGLRWIYPSELLFDKKANPKDYQYNLISTNIWNVFHEMSLRHPGWIYGARPYGNEYRYTMFFGVPSQRYWSRGASNNFIQRVNDIHDFLDKADYLSGRPLEFEYRKIYGDIVDDRTLKEVNVEADEYVKENSAVSELPEFADETNNMKASYVRRTLTGKAMKEYLNALNFRFTPFRRYHIFSSQRNLVWNGLLSSENALINAVDVTYFNEKLNYDGSTELEPVASHVFKAHSFIPEHMLRIAPVRWPNCKGYSVAMRYGMGELIHRMKDMYRGEIIILGNARVRPWDVGILTDTYNDMVGPIEVDQVVHNFSHETGFITEIKPAAIVIGNEISSFPIMEAMKTFSLAVHDIEANYIKLRGGGGPGSYDNRVGLTDPGAIRNVANIMNHWDPEELSKHLREKDPELFDKNGRAYKTLDELVFGGSAPRSELYEGLLTLERRTDKYVNNLYGPLLDTLPGAGYISPSSKALIRFNEIADLPSFAWLIGAPLLFLRCLKQDSVIVMPLMKNGRPIVSGLSYSDPTMIWNSVRGELRQLVDDTLDGTRDMISEYATIGSHIWNNFGETISALADQEAHVANLPLRGETQ